MALNISDPTFEEYDDLSADAVLALDETVSPRDAGVPWAAPYPPNVIAKGRHGHDLDTADYGTLRDMHQGILSVSLEADHPELERAVDETAKRFPGLNMVDTTQVFPPATLLKRDLREALAGYGDFLVLLGSSGTAVNDQAIRACAGALGGPKNIQLLVLDHGYGGAGVNMNAMCEARGWRGATSFPNPALVLDRDGRNIDAILAKVRINGLRPVLHMEDGIQGVGGFYPVDSKFLRELVEAVSKMGGLKVYDNVQALVRSGSGLLGMDRWADPKNPKHRPDAVTFAKGIGNGRGIAAAAIGRHVWEAFKSDAGNTFDTFSQPRDAMAAAREVLRIVHRDKLWENAAKHGDQFRGNLGQLVDRFPGVAKETVGKGALVGLRFQTAEQLSKAMHLGPSKGVVFAKGGHAEFPVARLPLHFDTDADFVDDVSQRMEDVVASVARMED